MVMAEYRSIDDLKDTLKKICKDKSLKIKDPSSSLFRISPDGRGRGRGGQTIQGIGSISMGQLRKVFDKLKESGFDVEWDSNQVDITAKRVVSDPSYYNTESTVFMSSDEHIRAIINS